MELRVVGYLQDTPLIQIGPQCHGRLNGCRRPGIHAEFLQVCYFYPQLQIALYLARIPYRLVDREVDADESFEMLARGEADLTTLAFRMTTDRVAKAAFTLPVDSLSFGYCSSEISESTSSDT